MVKNAFPSCLILAATLVAIFPNKCATAQDSLAAEVRTSIERSIPFIEEGGNKWIKTKKCVTCHQVTHMVWALNQAENHGFSLNRDALDFANEWTADWKHMTAVESRESADKEETLLKENDAIAALILGRSGANTEQKYKKLLTDYRESLVRSQQADGHWEPQGQLPSQKRPLRETREVSTRWALLAMATDQEMLNKHRSTFDNAIKWLESDTVGQSTEWWSTKLLVDRLLGRSDAANATRTSLLERQNADGGWGWLVAEDSDAFGTGLALYALSRDGMKANQGSIRSAHKFLTTTQNENGSWSVHGTKKKNRKRFSNTAVYWGTCWATIGMIESTRESVGIESTVSN